MDLLEGQLAQRNQLTLFPDGLVNPSITSSSLAPRGSGFDHRYSDRLQDQSLVLLSC